ncbi:MAG: carbohydrate kinase family protein [Brevefilum sp.]
MTSEISKEFPRFVIAGCLKRDFILPISGKPEFDILGGNLMYAAVGFKLWEMSAGLLARVGKNFPQEWLQEIEDQGFNTTGIKVLSSEMEQRRFLAHADLQTTHRQNPVQHFADRGLAFPSDLLGFRPQTASHDSRTKPLAQSIQISDVPEDYLEASAVHICPIDYLSHMLLPSLFRQGQATTITLTPSPGYMTSSFWEEIPGLLSEITALITPEEDIRNLFRGRQTDLWAMAAVLADFGPEYVLIRSDSWEFYVYDRVSGSRWVVPLYQTRVVDPTGAMDAFAGGFLAGYRKTYDPLEGALMGSVAASIVMEGVGPFFALEAMPELIAKRLEALRDMVQEVSPGSS